MRRMKITPHQSTEDKKILQASRDHMERARNHNVWGFSKAVQDDDWNNAFRILKENSCQLEFYTNMNYSSIMNKDTSRRAESQNIYLLCPLSQQATCKYAPLKMIERERLK